MSLIDDVLGLLLETLTIEPYTGDDAFGQPTYGTAYTVSGRVVQQPTMVRDDEGHEVVSGSKAYVDERPETITVKDRVTLPDGGQPGLLFVKRAPDSGGVAAVTLFFKG